MIDEQLSVLKLGCITQFPKLEFGIVKFGDCFSQNLVYVCSVFLVVYMYHQKLVCEIMNFIVFIIGQSI